MLLYLLAFCNHDLHTNVSERLQRLAVTWGLLGTIGQGLQSTARPPSFNHYSTTPYDVLFHLLPQPQSYPQGRHHQRTTCRLSTCSGALDTPKEASYASL
jgi:hypothetical protein